MVLALDAPLKEPLNTGRENINYNKTNERGMVYNVTKTGLVRRQEKTSKVSVDLTNMKYNANGLQEKFRIT